MKISTGRRAASTLTAAMALAASSTLSLPAHAAPAATDFVLESPELTGEPVGSDLSLRVTPTDDATINCSTIKLQVASAGGWSTLSQDSFKSGCWDGGVNLVAPITASLKGKDVRLVGRISGATSAPKGVVTVGDDAPLEQVVVLADQLAAQTPSALTITAKAPAIPASAIGQTASLRITATSGAAVDCDSLALQARSSDGRWSEVPLDYYSSGCWLGGTLQAFTVTHDIAGKALRVVGTATPTSDGPVTLTGEYTVGDQTKPLTVGVQQNPDATTDPAPVDPALPTPSPAPSSPAPTPSPAPSTPAPSSPTAGTIGSLDLPRIPWEGGASYYSAFPDAVRGGWTDPNHFPIAVWWGGFSSDAEIASDKSLGINTYLVLNPANDYRLLTKNHVSYIGTQLNDEPRDDAGWVGDWLDDEVDGQMSAEAGQAHLQQLVNQLPDHNKIRYANFTGMLISWFDNNPTWDAAAKAYANNFTDAVSMDGYWYSGPQCDWDDPKGYAYKVPFAKAQCRDGQAYGRDVAGMRWRDAQDGKLQPIFNFIENVDVAGEGYSMHELTPAEVKGAAMSSIINEARGLVWFNQSFGGKCATGNALRTYQLDPNYACANTVRAMGEVNNLLQSLAPVLNTQSYQWNFGDDLETMLKVHDSAAYIFAMSKDTVAPGDRVFTLPQALKGHSVQVVGENRTITPNADGTFTDSFGDVNAYHVYKIA